MSIVKTVAAEKLQKILKIDDGAVSSVWLRKNIEKDTADNGADGTPCEFWTADEVFFQCPYMTDEEIERDFDALWSAHSGEEPTISDRLDAVESALMELGDMVGGEDVG